jgi:hypothetical protein
MDYLNYINKKRSRDLIIIDIFRDPIERKISAFFQNLEQIHLWEINKIDGVQRKWNEFLAFYMNDTEKLIKIFNDKYILKKENYYSYDEWRHDGLRIDKHIFDQKKKYTIINHNNKKYFLLRFDQISKWEDIFTRNGFENFKLISSNISGAKNYSDLYNKFRKKFFFGNSKIIDLIFDKHHKNRYETFLTKEEIRQLKAKWYSKIV